MEESFLFWIDFEKAFGERLKDVTQYKESIYKDNEMQARIDGRLIKVMNTGTGIKQADFLSSLLFNVIMDGIIKKRET